MLNEAFPGGGHPDDLCDGTGLQSRFRGGEDLMKDEMINDETMRG